METLEKINIHKTDKVKSPDDETAMLGAAIAIDKLAPVLEKETETLKEIQLHLHSLDDAVLSLQDSIRQLFVKLNTHITLMKENNHGWPTQGNQDHPIGVDRPE